MQAIKQTMTVPTSRELIIHLPSEAAAHGKAEVIVLFPTSAEKAPDKLSIMKEAMSDQLFLADLNEVMQDFRYVDAEVVTE